MCHYLSAAASLYGGKLELDSYNWNSFDTGGADTIVACQHAFVLAMVLHPGEEVVLMGPMGIDLDPEVQKKAQVEIDQVTHGTRFPTLADRKQMPYVEAMITEALRWHSVAPTGLPFPST